MLTQEILKINLKYEPNTGKWFRLKARCKNHTNIETGWIGKSNVKNYIYVELHSIAGLFLFHHPAASAQRS